MRDISQHALIAPLKQQTQRNTMKQETRNEIAYRAKLAAEMTIATKRTIYLYRPRSVNAYQTVFERAYLGYICGRTAEFGMYCGMQEHKRWIKQVAELGYTIRYWDAKVGVYDR